MFIELHSSSAFSFLQGASLPETLVARAADLGYSALALVDADGVYGAPRFHKAATRAGVRAIIGAELSIGENRVKSRIPKSKSQAKSQITNPNADLTPHSSMQSAILDPQSPMSLAVLVESPEGYRNLCRLITRMKMRAPKGEGALALEELDGHTRGLVAVAGRSLVDARRHGVGGLLDRLVGVFGRANVRVELQRHGLRDQEHDNAALVALAAAFKVPLVVTNGVRFAAPADRPLFDVLTCVRHHTTVDEAGRLLSRNAERYLKPPETMARLFADHPGALAETAALAERLQYTMADLGYRFPVYPVPDGDTAISFLRRLTEAGARDRYRPFTDRAQAQIARELALIEKLDLAGYFLIVWDIVNFCRRHDILVQGRGSAANSAVCYSLGITAVDPIAMDLLFERFLSEERGEWPDIDLDLPSGDRREQVIQHVYEKYGARGAAMTANVITYRGRSAAREVGKALALDAERIDRLATVMHHFEFTDPKETLDRNLAAAGLSRDEPRLAAFADLWTAIQDLPRHLGQHSGGMVIAEGALDSVVPLEPASMPGRVVIQWDKDDCADMGIVKVDLLGLGMMAALEDAIELVGQAGAPLDLAHLPPDDPEVYALLQQADTVGVFQVESRAQMATLPRLRPERFYDLVVEVAIIRPGPIVGDMVHPYLNRRAGREPVVPLHPSLEPVLARTLGVPLFQEQLLRMAMVAAGFTGGQAEELRRAMGFKRSERRMREIEVQLRAGMAERGITGPTADRIVTSITSFALYGFPESHAASFALLAYASAYLKVHYPAAFYTALLNNQPMGFYHPASLVKDAQRRGVRFQPIDAQVSDWRCTVEPDGAIRLGLMYVTGLRKEAGQAMAAIERGVVEDVPEQCPKCGGDRSLLERVTPAPGLAEAGRRRARVEETVWFCNTCAHDWKVPPRRTGRFRSIEDVARRAGLRRDELATLADIGALNAFTAERRSALWQIERAVRPAGGELLDEVGLAGEEPAEAGPSMHARGMHGAGRTDGNRLADEGSESSASPLPVMGADERLQADYAGMGLTIGPHPMALRRVDLSLRGVLRATDLPGVRDGRRVRVAGMVITRQRPGTAKGFVFLTLEDETGIANVIVRPDLFDRQRLTIVGQPFLVVDGVLQQQDGVVSVRAERVSAVTGAAAVDAHDFY
ncbi:MAG: DNA polymerase III subunit alpha [Acidimicrobiia bacterium]|nr:DNA polymerase III subunit alpha [Acidimicrobiia bacterium]